MRPTLRQLRAAHAAAATLDPERIARREEREARARALLAALLTEHDAVVVPGYRVARTADGLTVHRLPAGLPPGWAQLEAWRGDHR